MANKMTKKEMFNEIIALVNGETTTVTSAEVISFCEHEIEILSRKKSSSAKSQKQEANEKIMDSIIDVLFSIGKGVTITEMQKASDEMAEHSNQKLSALMKKLVEDGRVIKEVEHKKSYFRLAE